MGWLTLYTVVLVDFLSQSWQCLQPFSHIPNQETRVLSMYIPVVGRRFWSYLQWMVPRDVPFLDVGLEWVRHWGVLGQQVPIFGITTLWSDLDIKMSVTLWKFWIHIVNLLCQWNSFLFLDYGRKLKLKSMPWFLKDNICMWKLNEMA